MDDSTTEKTDRVEHTRNGVFKQEGYNSQIDRPLDVEPRPKDAAGAAIDIRDMPDNGVVEVHDDDADILDREQTTPISR